MSCEITRYEGIIENVLADNGMPSKLYKQLKEVIGDDELALQAWASTKTVEFKEWFGDSKFVDNNGEPLLLFHGTPEQFDAFNSSNKRYNVHNTDKETFWFTDNINTAKQYGGNVLPVYLSSSTLEKHNFKEANSLQTIRALESQAIDNSEAEGIIFDTYDKGKSLSQKQYVVFSPLQIKSIYNEGTFSNEDNNIFKQVLKTEYLPSVDYQLKAINILSSDKAKQVFDKGNKNNWSLDKILTELAIPKEQKQLIIDNGKTNREEIITDLLANYSYTIEINTAKGKTRINFYEGYEEFGDENTLTQHYSNLTVPGGTNYTENEIATPAITPSIKGHAQFSTVNGIGWFRSDEQLEKANTPSDKLSPYANDLKPSKTRRILEVQSDLFQKGRDKEDLVNKTDKNKLVEFLKNEEKYLQQLNNELEEIKRLKEDDLIKGKLADIKQQENIVRINKQNIDNFERFKKLPDNQFLQLLNKDNNWVTFFVKSIIQDSAKQTITEVQESDVEAKVRELERESLLEIDCKGKLKAEKGLQTNFTKGGKWEIIKEFKGKSHAQGGIDIEISKGGIKMSNKQGKFEAKFGLIIPKNS